MEEITYVGLDAHAETTAIAVAEASGAAPRFIGTAGARFAELTKVLGKLGKLGKPGQLRVVYEAGPCGFAMVRQLRQAGYHCEVVAPSKTPRKPGDRVKTDRRDALSLSGLARAAQLTFVTVPDERDEAMRDLSRARIDAVRARLNASATCEGSGRLARRPEEVPPVARDVAKYDDATVRLRARLATPSLFGVQRSG